MRRVGGWPRPHCETSISGGRDRIIMQGVGAHLPTLNGCHAEAERADDPRAAGVMEPVG